MVALKIASRNFEPRSFEVLKKSVSQISESSMDTKHHGKKFLSAIFSVIIYWCIGTDTLERFDTLQQFLN